MAQSNQDLPSSSFSQGLANLPAQAPSRRPLVIGILHLVFAAIYLILAVNATNALDDVNQLPSSLRGTFRTAGIIDILADGVVCLGLLAAGVFLIQRRELGHRLTRIVAGIAIVSIVVLAIFILTAVSGADGAFLIGGVIGIALRFAYPIIAARLLGPEPGALGLT